MPRVTNVHALARVYEQPRPLPPAPRPWREEVRPPTVPPPVSSNAEDVDDDESNVRTVNPAKQSGVVPRGEVPRGEVPFDEPTVNKSGAWKPVWPDSER